VIALGDGIAIDEGELEERFILASGPGGQNVNKVASAVQLRFDARRSKSLPDDVRHRLERLAGGRLTNEGVIVVTAARFASQERNRADARARLAELIRRATIAPKPRRPTRVPAAAKRERLEAKVRRSRIKAARGRPAADD
jgi:ribosome-associated protein